MWRAALISWVLAGAAMAASNTVNVQISNQVNPQAGVHGRLQLAMSTSFQLAYDGPPKFSVVGLSGLYPQHTRVQMVLKGLPETAPGAWNYSFLDALMSQVQANGDHSPELQIGTAPAFLNDANGHLLPANFAAFAQMCADLVLYYNTGGFNLQGSHYRNPTPYPVTWWGIFNEPNGNGLTPQDYTTLYNTVVPAMALIDPASRFAAIELSDFGTAAESFLPIFVANVTAPVDAVATHFYSTCDQKDVDNKLFATVPGFAGEVQYIYQQLATQPALANVPVWVTENNVNSDYDSGNGMSSCNPGTPFVSDPRGTSPFFAAWRSLVFERLGEVGAQALYHWTYSGDSQYGEANSSGNPYLSYWVDYYLSHWLPSPPGQDILQTTASGCCLWIYNGSNPMGLDTRTLAARNPDGSVVILMSNYAIQNAADHNGTGAARSFALDVSALGSFTSASVVTLDAQTPSTGPVPLAVTPAAQMNVVLPGYGAALLRLSNDAPALSPASIGNSASYLAGAVAPGELVSLFGTAIGPGSAAGLTLTNPVLVANSVAGLHVLFDGVPAPILYASATQVNAVVPFAVAGHTSTQLQVDYLGALSAPVTLPVAAAAPGVFTVDRSGQGQGAIRNVTDESANSAANPVARGDWISIYATGAGATTPASVDGVVGSALTQANAGVVVKIDGLPCSVNYAGAAPGFISGVVQINAQVPAAVAPGPRVPLEVSFGGISAQAGITLAVK